MGKLDPNEAPRGYVAEKENFGCSGCEVPFLTADCLDSFCGRAARKDGCNVLFVKKPDDGKATASWPYDSEGTPVEVPHA